MHKPFLLDIRKGLLWARKMHFSPNTLHGLKQYWPFAVHTQTFSSGNKALEWLITQKSKKTVFCGLLGSRQIQTD